MNNISKRITALLMSGIIMVSASVSAMAQTAPEVLSASVVQELGAKKAVEWNGKDELKAKTAYKVSKNTTISGKVTIPAGTTVTVKKDAKLTIKGALTVKGTLKAENGGYIAVSGTLKEAAGKNISVSGTLAFGKKSNVTINGKLTINAKGNVKGEPKKLTLGKKSVVTIKGKNTSKKLEEALAPVSDTKADDEAIKKLISDTATAMLVEGDYAKMLEISLPEGMLADLKAEYEDSEVSFDGMIAFVSILLLAAIQEELGAIPESVEVNKLDIKYLDPKTIIMTDDVAKYFSSPIENAAEVSGSYTIKAGDKTIEQELGEDAMLVKMDGKWYFFDSGYEDAAL